MHRCDWPRLVNDDGTSVLSARFFSAMRSGVFTVRRNGLAKRQGIESLPLDPPRHASQGGGVPTFWRGRPANFSPRSLSPR